MISQLASFVRLCRCDPKAVAHVLAADLDPAQLRSLSAALLARAEAPEERRETKSIRLLLEPPSAPGTTVNPPRRARSTTERFVTAVFGIEASR